MAEKFNWCGYEWLKSAQNGRLIHPDDPNYWYDPGCITEMGDGVLALSIVENPKEIRHWDGKTYHPRYGTGVITSCEPFSYGTFECECMLPDGHGLWPAFWLSGHESWPPEIDIFEGYSDKNGCYLDRLLWRKIETNLHYRFTEEGQKGCIGAKGISVFRMPNPKRNWVRYSCTWEPRRVTFKVNGKTVRTFDGESVLGTFDGKTMHAVFDNWPRYAKDYGSVIDLPLKQPFIVKDFKYTEL